MVRIRDAFESTMQTISQIFPFVKHITTLSILSPKYGPLVPDLSQDCVCRPRTHLLFLHPGENGLAVCAGTGLPPPARAQRGGGWDAGQVPVLS